MIIISGGQTGVDRAALDSARHLRIPHGGWCPKGRKAEDGRIADIYHLKETKSDDYSERTKSNIADSDGTLIIVMKTPIEVTDGTILTIQEVKDKNKPFLIIDLSSKDDLSLVVKEWILENKIDVLNVAGPRESQAPGIYDLALKFMNKLLPSLLNDNELLKEEGCSIQRPMR